MTIKPLSYEERIATGCSHVVNVTYADSLATGTVTIQAAPVGTLVTRCFMKVTTAWNSATSATLSVGDTDSQTQFIGASDVKAGSVYFLAAASTNKVQVSASKSLTFSLAINGTPTAGAASIYINIQDVAGLAS